MPLELNAEEMTSLDSTTQIAGTAIRKLLEHYNQDANIQVHLELGTLDALIYRLNEIAGDLGAAGKKHLVIIQVNSLDKGFHPGDQSHYVGLIVDKSLAGIANCPYKVQYIDPMSHEMNLEIRQCIIDRLGLTNIIEKYDGGIQHAKVEGIEVVGNNHDCGAMLVYLMTRAAANQILPYLPLSENEIYHSKQIGIYLRNMFKKDNNDGTKTNLAAKVFGVVDVDYEVSDVIDALPSTSAFQWQIQMQFKKLKAALLIISKKRIKEISRFIGKEVTKLNKDDGCIQHVHKALIEMIKERMEEHIKNSIINDDKYREYALKRAEIEEREKEEREKLKEEELSGLDGCDRAIMEDVLDSENSREEDSSNSDIDDEEEKSVDSADFSNEEEPEEDDSSTTSANSQDESNNSDEVQVDHYYSNDMRGRLEKYMDDEADSMLDQWDKIEDSEGWLERKAEAEDYREWAKGILDGFGDLEDAQNLLSTFFDDTEGYSWFIHDLMMSSLDFEIDLLDDMVFVDGGITREEAELILATIDLFINWEEYNVLDQHFIAKTLLSAFKKFENGKGGNIAQVLEDLEKKLLYYEDEDVSPECKKIESKYNEAIARNDYVEAQRVWSIYTVYRKYLHDNKIIAEDGDDIISYGSSVSLKNSITIKERLDSALDRADLYEMRLYPHPHLKKLIYKDRDGVAEFNLRTLMGELETVGKNIEHYRPIEGGQKRKNIFVAAFTFVVSAKLEGSFFKREFVTVKLNLDYTARLLSKNPIDGVMVVGESLTAIAREDIIRGYKIFATETDGKKAADVVTKGAAVNINTNINHSERVLVQVLRKSINIIKIVQLLREGVVKKFGTGHGISYLVDAVALIGYSTNTVCDNCSPTLIYLQNSREEGAPFNLLVKELNKQVIGHIHFTTRGYDSNTGIQDFSKFRMQIFITARVNFASQAHDMTDNHCGTKQPNPPKKTYNPKAKLVLHEDTFDLCMAIKLEDGSDSLGQPYIVEFSGVDHSADYIATGQYFPGVIFTSGGDSWCTVIPKGLLTPNSEIEKKVIDAYNNMKKSSTTLKINKVKKIDLEVYFKFSLGMSDIEIKELSSKEGYFIDINHSITSKLESIKHTDRGGKAGLLCIDASMDPEYVMFNAKAFHDFGNALTATSEEFFRSYIKLLAIEDIKTTSRDIDLSIIGLSAQQMIRFEPTVRYFFKIMNIELPKFEISNEVRAGLDFAFGIAKINLDNSLLLGQVLESGSYYSTMKVYELMHINNAVKQPEDLKDLIKACSTDVIFGGLLGLSSASPVYGMISGSSICLNKYQLFKNESVVQTVFRYGADFISGALAIIALYEYHPAFIFMGAMNTVVTTDITVKVGWAIGDLVLNGMNSEFSNYTDF